MDLFEYQARDMFEKHGVPVLPGIVATTPAEAKAAAQSLGGGTVVVKAQVKTGGRGKAGGVKVVHNPADAEAAAEAILGMDIKGHTVHKVMIAAGAKIAQEFYFSVLLDRSERRYLAMCSVEGGVEIEVLAVERPEALARVAVDPIVGIDAGKAAEIVATAGFPADIAAPGRRRDREAVGRLREEDATLVEVNPLVLTEDGEVIALDGKVTIDENAGFRQRRARGARGQGRRGPPRGEGQGARPQLREARRRRGHHRQRRGPRDVDARRGRVRGRAVRRREARELPRHRRRRLGCRHGERPGRHPERPPGQVACSSTSSAASPRCIEVANGIVGALETLGDAATKPLVVRLDGNSVEEGREILAAANHPLVTIVETMDGAAAKAAELAAA